MIRWATISHHQQPCISVQCVTMRRLWRLRSCWTTGCTSCVVSHVLQPSSLLTRSMQVGAGWAPDLRTLHYTWFQAFHFLKANFNIVPSIPGSSKMSLAFRISYQKLVCVSLFPVYTVWLVCLILLIWSPFTACFKAQISLSVPYSETPSTCVLFLMWERERPCFIPIQNRRQNYTSVRFNPYKMYETK